MVQVVVVKGGRTQRFDPAKHGQVFLAKAAIKPSAPIAQNKKPETRVAGTHLLLASETIRPRQADAVTTSDFAAMFEQIEPPQHKPRRIIYDTRLQHRK